MFEPLVSVSDLEARESAPSEVSRWFVIDERAGVLVVDGEIPTAETSPVDTANVHLLGVDDNMPVWAVGAKSPEVPVGGEWLHLRKLYGAIEERDWGLAGRAAQIVAWDRDHRFCGRCGTETEAHPTDRAKQCPACGLIAYPRLAPAVIVLVERDDGRALLAWGRQFPGRFFSTLAGFVEPGESLEECIKREIKEEVGVDVDDVSYFGSQPWPFPHSLMIGFNARYAGGDLVLQEDEIVEAGWYAADDLPPAPRGGMSIAGWLIEDWIERRAAT